ncbi:uncharacterized protein LOC122301839 [Carya illinoinensis]|uniref:uncharacterized protein LOC122301839 n=1 Tax=Carya illinoinensis TaxID=32201 RepID=UPI001C71B47C|nr:uncharacterized protein LOC122301839 [Carya illinoinensis]
MIGLSWNCRGLGNPRTVRELDLLVRTKCLHFIFLMETKCGRKRAEVVRNMLHFENSFVVDSRGPSGGLAFLWKDTLDLTLENYSQNHISMVLRLAEECQQILLTSFYGFPESARKGDSWNLMKLIKPAENIPWLCFGDFNEILHNHEKVGGANRPYSQMEAFRISMEWCGLSDLGFVGPKFTWCNNRMGTHFTKERLDRALGNMLWTSMFNENNFNVLVAQTSDHCPLLISLNKRGRRELFLVPTREKIFRFEARWNLHEACNSIIKSCWSHQDSQQVYNINSVLRKLNRCKASLKNWSSTLWKHKRDIQAQLNRLLEMQDSNTGSRTAKVKALQKEIDKALEEENLKWKQRAKQMWLKDGDRNSNYFHKCANQRRKNNSIQKLVRNDGLTTTDIGEISSMFTTYFQELFSSASPIIFDVCLNQVHHRVNSEMNSNLTKQFTAEEVKSALFQMNPMGAPGPDGFPALFYQSHWDVVGEEVTKAVLDILNGNGEISHINETYIVLIPKVKNPLTVMDFRPISLCNIIYKVVSKTLSNRLKLILPSIIAPTQSAFIQGRMIQDNVIVAFETLHSMSIKGKGQQGYMAIKLDLSKAFDRVEWEFLAKVMAKMGFNRRWIFLTMQCVTTVSYSTLINGKPQGNFSPLRGIRQGDPLSPYLFILVAEVLSSLLNHAETTKLIQGFPICRGRLSINHLLFADDSLLFCRANAREWASIQVILNLYEEASGQKLNKSKTSIYFSPNTRPATREYILSLAQTRASFCYERYLGLPNLIGRSKYAAFKGILDRVRGKVSNWKNKFLSQAGKDILLKAVVQALPTYCMGVFKLPKSLLGEINKVMNQFWWGHLQNEKKVHWLSWGQMGRSKTRGGLGYRDLESFNLALLAKQGWRLLQYPDSIAAQVLKLKYFPNVDFFQAKLGSRPSFIWRSIQAARGLVEKGSLWRIGNGLGTKIWKDRWLPQPSSYKIQSPVHLFPENEVVARLINNETKQWDRGLTTTLFGPDTASLIQRIPISFSGANDRLIWLGTKDGSFSVKSAYHLQKESMEQLKGQSSRGIQNKEVWTGCWKLQIPNATKIFIWRACLESLPTMLNLSKRKIVDSPICPICCREQESTTHALWECTSAMDVWSQGHIVFQKSSLRKTNFKELFESLYSQCDQSLMEQFSVLARSIWSRRNKMIFEGSFVHPSLLVNQASQSLTDYRTAQENWKTKAQIHSQASVWSPPPSGVTKINWDAAVDSPNNRIGIGLVARDQVGNVMISKKLSISCLPEPLLAEAIGAFHAVSLAKEMGLTSVICEGDSLQVVNGLNLLSDRGDNVGMFLSDTKSILSSFSLWSMVFVGRSGNHCAHVLAKESLMLAVNSTELVYGTPCNRGPF